MNNISSAYDNFTPEGWYEIDVCHSTLADIETVRKYITDIETKLFPLDKMIISNFSWHGGEYMQRPKKMTHSRHSDTILNRHFPESLF